jgi:hypothetical protein
MVSWWWKPWRSRRPPGRLGIVLVGQEQVEVGFDHVPQSHVVIAHTDECGSGY